MPPATTLPPWTPPLPPAPSQTNIPAPLPSPFRARRACRAPPGTRESRICRCRARSLRRSRASAGPPSSSTRPCGRPRSTATTSSRRRVTRRTTSDRRSGPGSSCSSTGPGPSVPVDDGRPGARHREECGGRGQGLPERERGDPVPVHSRLSLTITDAFIRNDSPSVVDQFGLRRGRQVYDTNTLGVTVDWLLGQIATQAYYRNVLFFNESGER